MKTLEFTIDIAAPRETVWNAMLAPDTYRDWTSAFMEGCYYEGSWEQGARIRFLAPDGSGGSGMISEIAENRRFEFLSIRHLGFVKDGVEDTESPAVRSWAPSFENYTFEPLGSATRVRIDLDVTPDFEADMQAMWPKALARLKAICEAG